MSTPVSLQTEAMVDPRGEFRAQPVQLAKRLAGLKGRTVMLFDNTQLASQEKAYGPVFKWLGEHLQAQGAKCVSDSHNLLRAGSEGVLKQAERVAASGAEAVVVAMCNAGITQPTSYFAAELERRGIPCVQMCTELAYELAGVTAAGCVPGLPVVKARVASGEGADFGKAEAMSVATEVVAGLTDAPAVLLERFNQRFAGGALSIAKDGRMQLPAVSADASGTIAPSDAALYEELSRAELGDGLPVIAPTQSRVAAMLACTDYPPEHVLVESLPPSGASLTVRALAANAVMAGCKPEYLPILIAAFQGMSDPVYRLAQGAISTHPAAHAVVVSGPLAGQIGMQSGAGCLGPGFRANATIGRAVNLTVMNVSRARPGKTDLGIFGSPAEFTYCFAESDAGNPWTPLHTDLFGPEVTSVTVHKCEGPHNVADPRMGPEDLLRNVAATATTVGGNNLGHPCHLLVMLNPGQARMLAKAGWSKRRVQEFLFEEARHPQAEVLRRRGNGRYDGPEEFLRMPMVPVLRSPDDAIVIVAGDAGSGSGGFAMVGIPWGNAKAVSRAVTSRDGTPLKVIKAKG